jgi:hypothetical protein
MKTLRLVILGIVLISTTLAAAYQIVVIKPDRNTVAVAGNTLEVRWTKTGSPQPDKVSIVLRSKSWPGQTVYNYTLARNTPNDGYEVVTLGPFTVVEGMYTLFVAPEGVSSTGESAPFRVNSPPSAKPDLVVCLEWDGKRPTLNEHFLITCRIINKGTMPSGPCRIDWYVEGLGTRPFDVPGLAPNARHTVQHEFWWPTMGHKTVQVTVDPAKIVAESNEGNNVVKGQVSVRLSTMDPYVMATNLCSDK